MAAGSRGERLGTPPRFERAITWSRLIGAVAVIVLAPLLPNLGPIAVGLLSGSLITAAVVLHVLSGRMRRPEDTRRLSWVTFVFDVAAVSFAMLLIAPDPNWPLIPLIGVLLIITTAFRLGELGAVLATGLLGIAVLSVAAWRAEALAMAPPVPQLLFDLLLYSLTALITTSMLREVGLLRSDVATLRESEREQTRLLEHEREARSAAERTMTHLGTVERISESVLRHESVDDVMQDALDRVVTTTGATAAAVLTATGHGFVVRASSGLILSPRSTFARGAELERALDAIAQQPVATRTIVPLGAEAAHGVLYLGFARKRDVADDRALLELVAGRLATALERAKRLETERTARAVAESAAERAQLLLDAADAALDTADVGQRLERLARIAVPKLADSCAIDLLRPSGRLETVALAAVDAERERDMWMAAHRYPRTWTAQDPLFEAIRTSEPQLVEHLGPEDLAALTRGPEHLRTLLEREVRSWMGVPVTSGGKVIGAVELYSGESGRTFTQDDLATARLFALRVAAAASRGGDTIG